MTKEIEKKVKEILAKHHLDGYCYKFDTGLDKCTNELLSLILSEKMEAVDRFVEKLAEHFFVPSPETIEKENEEYSYLRGDEFSEALEQYKTQMKGGK